MIFGLLLLVVGLLLIVRHRTWKAVPWPKEAVTPTPFQGHRGYWQQGAQENTLAAFRAAKAQGFQMVELDVQLSGDGVAVVFHDGNLKRLAGSTALVSELTAGELGQQAQAPTLEEVLSASDVPTFFNIELKTDKFFDGRLEEAVAKVVQECRAEGRVIFSSFNPLAVFRLSRLLPNVPRALLASKEKEPGNRIYLRHLWLAPYVNAHILNLDHHYWTPSEVAEFRKRGIPVALWTVNDSALARQYLNAGAVSIISDKLHDL